MGAIEACLLVGFVIIIDVIIFFRLWHSRECCIATWLLESELHMHKIPFESVLPVE